MNKMFLFFLYTCKSPNDFQEKDYSVKMIIMSPGGCVDLIYLNENGGGYFFRGSSKNSYLDSFSTLNQIDSSGHFIVKEKSDLTRINALINEIEQEKVYKKSYIADARHMQLFIKGKLKMDFYSVFLSKFEDVLILLMKHLPFDINVSCHF